MTSSASDIDKHLFTSSSGLAHVVLTQEADFQQHAEDFVLCCKTFLTRESLLTCVSMVTKPGGKETAHVDVKEADVARRLCQVLAWWIMYYPKDFDSDELPESAAFLRGFQELLLTVIPHSELGNSLQSLFYETVARRMETKTPKSTLNLPPVYSAEALLKSGKTNSVPLTIAQLKAPPKAKGPLPNVKYNTAPRPPVGTVRPQTAVPPTPAPAPAITSEKPVVPAVVPAAEKPAEENEGEAANNGSSTAPLSSALSESSAAAVSRLDSSESEKRRALSFSSLPPPPPPPPPGSSSRSRTPDPVNPPDTTDTTDVSAPPQTPPRPRAATFSGSSTSATTAAPRQVAPQAPPQVLSQAHSPPPPSSPPMVAPIPTRSTFQSPSPAARALNTLKSITPHRLQTLPFHLPNRQTLNHLSARLPVSLQPRTLNHVPEKVDLAWFAWRYGALAVAQQIALVNYEMYFRVDPPEWAIEPYSWEIEEMNRWTGRLTKWVANEVISPERIQERSHLYEIFVDIAEHLQKLNDYNGMVVLLNAIQVSAISRMKATLKNVNTVTLDKLNVLSSLIKVDERYKDLRQLIRLTGLPGVPYPGIYVKELIYVRTGIPSFLDKQKTIINFTKVKSLTRCLRELTRFRESPYDFEPIPEIQDYLRNWPLAHTHDTLFQLSLQREPREK